MSDTPAPVTTKSEPVVLYASIGVVVSAAAAAAGLTVDAGAVGDAIAAVVAVAAPLVAAFKARSKVTPVA